MNNKAGNMLSCVWVAWFGFPCYQPGAGKGQGRQSLQHVSREETTALVLSIIRCLITSSGSFQAAHRITFSLQHCMLQSWAGRQLSKWNTKMLSSATGYSSLGSPGASCNTKTTSIPSTFLRHFQVGFFFSREGNISFTKVLLVYASSIWLGNELN